MTVYVDDLNDNKPQFLQPVVSLSVSESSSPGSSYVIPAAVDADSPQFGVQRYELDSRSNKFGLQVTLNIDGSQEASTDPAHFSSHSDTVSNLFSSPQVHSLRPAYTK